MSLTRIPLPSIALVLTSDRLFIPTRPSAIAFDPLQTVYPTVSNNSNDIETRQCNPAPAIDEQPFLNPNDSATNVGQSEGDDVSDEETVVTKKKPTSLCGFFTVESVKLDIKTLVTAVNKLLRTRANGRTSRVGRKVTKDDVQQ